VTSERAGTVALKVPADSPMPGWAAVLLVELVRYGVTVPLAGPAPVTE
jgi:hypothetical protein